MLNIGEFSRPDMPFLTGYNLVRTVDDWRAVLAEAAEAPVLSEDYETRPPPDRLTWEKSALRPEQGTRIAGIGLAWRSPEGLLRSAYVGIRHHVAHSPDQPNPEEILALWREFCRNRPRHKLRVGHNFIRMEQGMNLVERIPWPLPGQGHDTMVACRITGRGIGSKELLGLKGLRTAHLPNRGYDQSKDGLDDWLKARGHKPGRDIWLTPVELAGMYGAGDVCSTLELWEDVAPLVYRPWQYEDEFGWWWDRGHFEIDERPWQGHAVSPEATPTLTDQPAHPALADLYDLEIETAYQALLASQGGTRFDIETAGRLAAGATALRSLCDKWLQHRVSLLPEEDLAVIVGPKGKGTPAERYKPGSTVQLKRLMFGDGGEFRGLGLEVNTQHMSKKFQQKNTKEQESIVKDPVQRITYAAMDIDAMKEYLDKYPEHRDLLMVVGARRKMTTVLQWAQKVPSQFALRSMSTRWWDEAPDDVKTHRVYHQVGTVQTTSGRMSSSDYNGTNVSSDKALLIPGDDNKGNPGAYSILCQHFGREHVEAILLRPYIVRGKPTPLCDVLHKKGHAIDFGVRRLFMADPDCAGRPIDLSQIEVRIFAGLTGNALLCKGYGRAPTAEEVAVELSLLKRLGSNEITVEEYQKLCRLDVTRHWRGAPIDAHSLVTAMTTTDVEMRNYGFSEREDLEDVLQLCAADEDRAILRTLQAVRSAYPGVDVRQLSREDLHAILQACDAADLGDAKTLVKLLVRERKGKKGITFGIMYGMGVTKLAISLGMTLDEAKLFLESKYFAKLPEAKSLPKDIEAVIIERSRKTGIGWMRHRAGRKYTFAVKYDHWPSEPNCPTGAKGKRPGPNVRPCRHCRIVAQGAYVAVNRFIQGYAAALFKMGFVRAAQLLTLPRFGGQKVDPVTRRRYGKSRVDREIHDENIFMLHRTIDNAVTDFAIRSCMTLATRVGVPLDSSSERFVDTWAEKEDVRYGGLEANA